MNTERTELQQAIDEAVDAIMSDIRGLLVSSNALELLEHIRITTRVTINYVALKALDVSEAAAHAAIAGMEARVKGEK